MDTSFTEHVLERAKERQKKLLPLREANFGTADSKSQPNLRTTPNVIKAVRKDVVSDPIVGTSTPDKNSMTGKMTKQSSKTSISSMVTGSLQGQINTLNIERDNLNMEIKISSCDNVRVEVEIDTDGDNNENIDHSAHIPGPDVVDCENNENSEGPALREHAKNRLQRLGQLYSGSDDLSSPIHRTEANFLIDDNDKEPRNDNERKVETNKTRKGLGKLADLANNINQWEDEITPIRKDVAEKKTPIKKSWKAPAPQPPVSQTNSPAKQVTKTKAVAPKPPSSPEKSIRPAAAKGAKGPNKQIKWDPSVIESLEANKTKQKTSNIEKVQEEREPESVSKPSVKTKTFVPLKSHKEDDKVTPRSPVKNRSNAIAGRAAIFEQGQTTSPAKKDPALLSVSERKALFEKNRGEALVPKAAFGMAAPIKTVPKQQPSSSNSIAGKIAELTNKNKTISQDQIERKVSKERQEEMEVLLNRFNQNKQITVTTEDTDSESEDEHTVTETTAMITTKSVKIVSPREVLGTPPPPPLPSSESRKSGEKRTKKGDSPQVQAVLGEVKRIKVTQPKDGKLYPCLSDIEAATETETEQTVSPSPQNSLLETSFCGSDDGANTSFGRDILRAVCIDKSNQQTDTRSDSSDSSISDVLEDMNDYLDELDQDTDISGPTPPKQGKLVSPQKTYLTQPSESFHYKNYNSPRKQKSPTRFKSPCKIITSPKRRDTGDLPTHVVDGKDVMPLTYTVSFYRKQQTQASTTPVRQISRPTCVDEEEDDDDSVNVELDAVSAKIDQLLEEINKQQMVISQTSRALNLCNATPEFTGSTEQVEAEKVLLLATHRRQAATVEVQRLKVEQSLRPLGSNPNMPLEKGTLTISNITLPLKKEYVRALAAAGGKGHHVVCLVKSGEQVVITQLVSTVASSSKNPDLELKIPGQVKLENIYSDFAVTFEVYCLQAQEEFLPHEVKYHIGKKASSKLTPKKSKQDSRMMRPPKESPAGPQAVRTSSLALNGYVIFSIQAINKTNWTLNKTPPISPLEGCVSMKVNCVIDISVELRGFLNMFEDVSGLGAWHRRWCLLKGQTLSYWKYPEDERKKAPIDTIDLKSCITKKVGPVSRDICARLNTFLLERERPAQQHDKDTLTVVCESNKTIIRHLLSADCKEERTEWCDNFNKALNAIRIWGTKTDV